MEEEIKKCSNNKHSDIDAINFCPECNLYLCNKCTNTHSDFFGAHNIFNLNKKIEEIFTGKCKEFNHKLNLEYYCKNHNKLVCAACISKIKDQSNGQHSDCNVCSLNEIKEEKKGKLNDNINYLKEFSKTVENSIKELKKIFVKLNDNKDKLKKEIANIFTKIRSALNDRETDLLLEVDTFFDEKYFKEDLIKQGEKTPNRIKIILDKEKSLNEGWNDKNKLVQNINESINIENNIKNIKDMGEIIKKYNSEVINVCFFPKENEISKILEKIKKFGEINDGKYEFKFIPQDVYNIDENGVNIIKNHEGYDGVLFGNKEIPKNKITKWKIKIKGEVRYNYNDIFIGIGDINSKTYDSCWSIYSACSNIRLYLKEKTLNYNNHEEKLKKDDVIEVIVDRISNKLSFTVNDVNFGVACENLPKEEALFPTLYLYQNNHSVELLN